jgi:hypothetical protein
MKKNFYLAALLVLFVIKVSGQGAILTFANNGPVPGDVFTSFNCDTTGINQGSSGAGQTWNYSGLSIDTSHTVLTYVDPSTTPYFSTFPAATVAYMNGQQYSYIKANSADYSILGISNSVFTLAYSNPEILCSYPFSYGQTIVDSLKGSYSIGGINFSRSGTRTTIGDGYGTLILPSGTYNNMLRVKMIQNYKDSSNTTLTLVYNVAYQWYDGVHKNSCFQIYNTSNTVNGTVYTGKFVTVSSAVSDIAELNNPFGKPVISPNPSKDIINIYNAVGNDYEIFDLEGRAAQCGTLTTTGIDLSKLNSGTYLIRLMDGKGRMNSVKFVKE